MRGALSARPDQLEQVHGTGLDLGLPAPERGLGSGSCRKERLGVAQPGRPTMTLSMTDRSPNSRMFWNVRAMPSRATRSAGRRAMSWPSSSIEPVVGADHPRQQVEQRRLARAVRPDDAVDGARRQAQVVVGEREQAAEALGEPPDGEDGLCLRSRSGGQARHRCFLRGGQPGVDAEGPPEGVTKGPAGNMAHASNERQPRGHSARRRCPERARPGGSLVRRPVIGGAKAPAASPALVQRPAIPPRLLPSPAPSAVRLEAGEDGAAVVQASRRGRVIAEGYRQSDRHAVPAASRERIRVRIRARNAWWAVRDSNPRHPRCKRGALTS